MSMCCCSTRPARSRSATAWRRRFIPRPASRPNDLAASAQLSSLADETPEGRSIVVLAKEKFGLRAREMHELRGDVRAVHRADADERRRSSCQRRAADHARAQRRGGSGARICRISGRNVSASGREDRRGNLPSGGTPLVVASDMMTLGVDRAQRRGQRRNQGALRAAAQNGNQDGDDHRRQSADRRRHRG